MSVVKPSLKYNGKYQNLNISIPKTDMVKSLIRKKTLRNTGTILLYYSIPTTFFQPAHLEEDKTTGILVIKAYLSYRIINDNEKNLHYRYKYRLMKFLTPWECYFTRRPKSKHTAIKMSTAILKCMGWYPKIFWL
jgi:hypothetical protein